MNRGIYDMQIRQPSATSIPLLQLFSKKNSVSGNGGNTLAKRLFIAATTLSPFAYLFILLGHHRQLYTFETALFLSAIFSVAISAIFIRWNTRYQQAETALQRVKEEIEQRVEARTTQLWQTNEQLQCEIIEHEFMLGKRKQAELELRASEERFRATFNQVAVGMAHIGIDGKWLLVNQKLCDIVGYTAEELQSRTLQDLTYSLDLEIDLKYVRQLLTNKIQTCSIEKRYIRKDAELVWVELTLSLVRDFLGEPKYFIAVVEDITKRKQAEKALTVAQEHLELQVQSRTAQLQQEVNERKRVEEELRESKLFAESITECSTSIIYVFDLATMTNAYSNRDVAHFLGYSQEQIYSMGKNFLPTVVHPDDMQHRIALLEQFNNIKDGEVVEFEQRLKHVSGEWRWIWHREVVFKRQPNGEPYQIMGTAQDISERKKAEKQIKDSLQEKEVLLKEIHHRVKNNLQVIESLLRLQSRYSKDEQVHGMFKESQNRIKSMALIHEKLYQSQDLARINFPEYIRSLTASLFRSYRVVSADIELQVELDDVCLKVDTAISCGLIINEIVANSLKHAFLQAQEGRIYIYLKAESDSKLLLVIGDDGVGIPNNLDFRNTESLGLQLVTSLAEQLEASIELNRDAGTEFRLAFTDSKT